MKTKHLNDRVLTQSQKMMIFVLSMATFGVADIITEVIPEISLGPIDFSVAYFAFIPLTLAILFDPISAGIGAALGELVFSDLIMGDFGGLSEFEGFLQLSIAMIVAGSIVKDPRNRKQLIMASLVGVGIDKLLGGIVDIAKVYVGVADFEAVKGLPQSVLLLEGIAFSTDMIITGILFGVIPTCYLVPKLYGKIEPLLGIKPRVSRPNLQLSSLFNLKNTVIGASVVILSAIIAFLSELGFDFGEWEPDFLGKYGNVFLYSVIAAGLVLTFCLIFAFIKMAKNKEESTFLD